MNIAKNIATFRKAKNMTQEDLAEIIGVSAQAVSKWENGANLPDIMLLPLLAATFGVSIDALFGTAAEVKKVPFDDIPAAVTKDIRELLLGNFDAPSSDPYAEDEKCMTMVFSENGGCTFTNRDIAVNLQSLRVKSLLGNEDAVRMLEQLADVNFQKALLSLIETPVSTITPSYLTKICGFSAEETQSVLDQLCSLQLAGMKNITVDGEATVVYVLSLNCKLPLILAILQLADLCRKNLWYYGYRGTYDYAWLG